MSDPPATLPSFPSTSDAFKQFQRHSLPPQIPIYKPQVAEEDNSESHVIRFHSNLLAFQPRTRQRINSEPPPKKKAVRRKRKEGLASSEDERYEPSNSVTMDSQNTRPRRRCTRRASSRPQDNDVVPSPTDEPQLTDDEDFM